MNHYFVSYVVCNESGEYDFEHALIDTEADMYAKAGFNTVLGFLEASRDYNSVVILNFQEMDD